MMSNCDGKVFHLLSIKNYREWTKQCLGDALKLELKDDEYKKILADQEKVVKNVEQQKKDSSLPQQIANKLYGEEFKLQNLKNKEKSFRFSEKILISTKKRMYILAEVWDPGHSDEKY